VVEIAIDSMAWIAGLFFAYATRLDWALSTMRTAHLAELAAVTVVLQVLTGHWSGLYRGRSRYGSFDEVVVVLRTVAVVCLVVALVDALTGPPRILPLSVPPGGAVAALLLMMGVRYVFRIVSDLSRRPNAVACKRLIVFGAGDGAEQVVAALLRSPTSPYLPVVLLDDDPHKRNLRIMGVRVMGTRADIAAAAARYRADAMLIAIPSANAELVRELAAEASDAGIDVKVLPVVGELIDRPVGVADIRTPTVQDLMGRRELDTDVAAIASYLEGKRVLVTGAGGSIGSELCRQVRRFKPASLVMLDRDESALHGVLLSIEGHALMDADNLALVDIRDRDRLRSVMAAHRPQVVFHAAALKHLPLLENSAAEAVKTNVRGTANVLDACIENDVERFVNISTDKAADPVSVLGYSKRVAERLTAHADRVASGTYLSVRFGNVLGSRGSVLSTFQTQIANGGPVTVTHPEATRYFMTVEEAVQLVIQAGALGGSGEALVLDMGAPVRIADIARQMIEASGKTVPIVFTGLRQGEKLHEQMMAPFEVDRRPRHVLISHVTVPPLDPRLLRELVVITSNADARRALEQLSGAGHEDLVDLRSDEPVPSASALAQGTRALPA
jgi:FlaA1/EpsC-like NDP-sugar epimerase